MLYDLSFWLGRCSRYAQPLGGLRAGLGTPRYYCGRVKGALRTRWSGLLFWLLPPLIVNGQKIKFWFIIAFSF